MNQRLSVSLWMPLLLTLSLVPLPAAAAESEGAEEDLPVLQQVEEELPVFQKVEKQTHVPWYFLAAVNQYEMGIHWKKNRENPNVSPIQIEMPSEKWSGPVNPNLQDNNPLTIQMFGGMGQDGNGDKVANRTDPDDELYTMAKFLGRDGNDENAVRNALWNYYQDGIVVDRITGFARLFQTEGSLVLRGNSFPIPQRYNYSYRSTWGDARGWGGRRSHEGCDIFANTGTPVLSTAYGVVEVAGWNKFGGWRVGIRDLNNVYHYYAHLASFDKGMKRGALVKPGQVIGYVGSSGYGRPGTSGKFAPHLHYGMYRDTGTKEWAFDPTPHLRKWEREARANKKKK
ncbi:M23 family metallopeptidase [Tumebacillus permanentifrigoris]|uniref:Peptidase M23-like protein n=1 Tax=Tumebacillus permanentifrigoris TaxID=378543 RepID=A0A316D9R0_9BACL|nr:M23 family metallopeptidase [Tumebacillus permanentifrigoris]PWK13908.1 peptidase M23-like protein [Tumebacillus permanentifrigoris]